MNERIEELMSIICEGQNSIQREEVENYITNLQEENKRLNNIIDKAIIKLNKFRNREDSYCLWCMKFEDSAEVIKSLGGKVK